LNPSRVCHFFTLVLAAIFPLAGASLLRAQENPYIVAYDHNLEEPGNLEVEYFSTFGTPRGGPNFHAFWSEFEYGATAWWTTELYLSGQTTFGDSTVFTGYRWENRVRPLKNEHWINPVLYVEFEDINGADKIMKEIEGHDVESDFLTPNVLARQERKREVELKLILSSNYKGWNFTENTLAVKNLSNEPCLQHFIAGVEMYGGLGDRYHFGLRETSQYLAPGLAWNLPSGWTFKIEPTFGLNDNSHQFLLRWGVSCEISGFGQKVSQLFKGKSE
jgi:hypothetical protein